MDFTRSTKAVFEQRVCKRQRKKAGQTFNSVFYANPIRNPSLYVRMGLSIRLENFSSNDGNSILQCWRWVDQKDVLRWTRVYRQLRRTELFLNFLFEYNIEMKLKGPCLLKIGQDQQLLQRLTRKERFVLANIHLCNILNRIKNKNRCTDQSKAVLNILG